MGSFIECCPDVKIYWDCSKNILNIEEVSKSSRKEAHWVCPVCGYRWKESIRNLRIRKHICPVCRPKSSSGKLVKGLNDLETLRPDLVLDWDWTLNIKKPCELQLGSKYMVYWVCHRCGHKWKSRLDTRTKNGCGCPVCVKGRSGSSIADYTIYILLKYSLKSEVLYRYRVEGYEVDIFIPSKKICIEYDGYRWHEESWGKRYIDEEKESFFLKKGYSFYRIRERNDKFLNIQYEGRNIAYVPMVREDIFMENKNIYAEVMSQWGIIRMIDVKKDYWAMSNFFVKSKVLSPPYEKSFKYFLENSGYSKLFWDYENNDVKPEDVYAGSSCKVWMKCKNGHSVRLRISSMVRSNHGCAYCSGQVSKLGLDDIIFY